MSRILRDDPYADPEASEGGDIGEGLSNQPENGDDDSNNE